MLPKIPVPFLFLVKEGFGRIFLFLAQLLFFDFDRTRKTTTNRGNPFVWIGYYVFHVVAAIPCLFFLDMTGFTVAAVYTANLFALARRLDNKNNMNHSERLVSTTTDNVGPQMRTSPTLMVTMLYGLAAVLLGTTGSILAMNYGTQVGNAACSPAMSSSTYVSNSNLWTTNVTRLPANVQKWARQQLSSHATTKNADGFVHLPGSGTTIFTEWKELTIMSGGPQDPWNGKIWTVSPPPPPQCGNSNANVELHHHHGLVAIHDFAGHDFVLTSPRQACFVTIRSFRQRGNIIACYDDDDNDDKGGKTRRRKRLRFTKRNERGRQYQSRHPRNLISVPVADTAAGADMVHGKDKMVIWYLDNPPDRSAWSSSDQLVYSLDPTTMIETLHSTTPVDNDQRAADGTSCPQKQEEQMCRRRAHSLVWLWLCALPLTVTSIYLWYHRQVPSMSLTTFGGLTFVALCLYWLCYGDDPSWHVIQGWMLIFGASWTIFSINGLLVSSSSSSSMPQQQQQQQQQGKREQYKDPMWWGLHIGSLSYFVAMWVIIVEENDWALVHALIWVPMLILGVAAQSPLLQVLTAGRLWMDTMYVAALFPGHEHSVHAMTGLMMVIVGGWLSHRQGAIAAFFRTRLEPYAWPPRRRRPPEASTTAAPVTPATLSRSKRR